MRRSRRTEDQGPEVRGPRSVTEDHVPEDVSPRGTVPGCTRPRVHPSCRHHDVYHAGAHVCGQRCRRALPPGGPPSCPPGYAYGYIYTLVYIDSPRLRLGSSIYPSRHPTKGNPLKRAVGSKRRDEAGGRDEVTISSRSTELGPRPRAEARGQARPRPDLGHLASV